VSNLETGFITKKLRKTKEVCLWRFHLQKTSYSRNIVKKSSKSRKNITVETKVVRGPGIFDQIL